LLNAFIKDGSRGLIPKKTGPKKNYVRTDSVVAQIIRHRFLDPDAKAEVIAQKLKQTGVRVSQRTVERTITEYGLQKKTLQVSAQRASARD
jgi:arginine repressor